MILVTHKVPSPPSHITFFLSERKEIYLFKLQQPFLNCQGQISDVWTVNTKHLWGTESRMRFRNDGISQGEK